MPSSELVEDDFAYVTTVGRRTGRPHTIEIWFAELDGTLYLLSGGGDRSDWVRNLRKEPRVRVRIGGSRELDPDLAGTVDATAREVKDPAEAQPAREALAAKYRGWKRGDPLDDWAAGALLVAIDREPRPDPG